MNNPDSRRSFLGTLGLGSLGAIAADRLLTTAEAQQPGAEILGAGGVKTSDRPRKAWQPHSDRKIRVGIVGYGVCQFGAAFGFQDHPNVAVAAVSDLFPDRCAALAKACRCEKTYPSLEELIKDDSIEAVFVATDAPSHARHCIEVLKRGKHVACAVPAVFGSIEQAHELYEAVKSSGRKYMMFETSAFHEDCHAMRQVYRAGGFGKLVYSEGEYLHYSAEPIPSFREWRVGLPPQWYPTHSTAYYVAVSGGHFTNVTCLGMPSLVKALQPGNNAYKNPFGTEVALLRTSEGGMAHGRELGHLRARPRDGPRVRAEGVHGGPVLHRAGGEAARPGASGPAADGGTRRPRRLARPPDDRVRGGDPGGPRAAGGHRGGAEHDGPRHRCAPVGPEGRRDAGHPTLLGP